MKTLKELFNGKIDTLNNPSSYKIGTEEQMAEWAKKYEMKSFDFGEKGSAYFLIETSTSTLLDCRLYRGTTDVSNMVASQEQMKNIFDKYSSM